MAGADESSRWTDALLDRMRELGDPVADIPVAAVLERDGVDAVRAIMRSLIRVDQPVPEELPDELQAYLLETLPLPEWADADRIKRGQQLFAEGVLPAQQKEDLEWQLKSAQAKLEKSKSDLAAAEIDLSYAVIRAPISGTVASVSTQEGETVAASFAAPTFVTIIEDNALELVAMVDETDIANVRPGDTVNFTVEAYPSREMPATVKRIDPP